MKVAIASNVIEDENSSSALNTMKSLASALPPSKRKTVNRMSTIQNPTTTTSSQQPGPSSAPIASPQIPFVPIPLTSQPPPVNSFSSAFESSLPKAKPPVVKLHGSVVETVNVLIRDGSIEKLLLTGEISVSIPQNVESVPPNTKFKLSIHGTDAFEHFVANEAFAAVQTGEDNGLVVDLSKLASVSGAAATQLAKYQVRVAEDDLDFYAPILANPMWKCDVGSASLLLAYEYNSDLITQLDVGEVRILANLVDGGDLVSAQMKPEGAFDQARRSLLWAVGALDSKNEEPIKLIARVETSGQATPGTIAIQFKAVGRLLSGIDIDVHDDAVVLKEVAKSVVSGKYACFM
ncbi:hypothetical protein HDU98_005912 [Podochytrium sp. JEL0797]|nr:hypothetical protein HDU98_005912 [Podochytrium sp. JEL0797]